MYKRQLLHLVDALPDDQSDPIDNALAIEQELAEYSDALIERPIWVALSKVDQLDDDALGELVQEVEETFPDRPIYAVSALGDIGLTELKNDLMQFLTEQRLLAAEDPDFAEELVALEKRISDDVFRHSERMRNRRSAELADSELDLEDDDGEFDGEGPATEVIYVRE